MTFLHLEMNRKSPLCTVQAERKKNRCHSAVGNNVQCAHGLETSNKLFRDFFLPTQSEPVSVSICSACSMPCANFPIPEFLFLFYCFMSHEAVYIVSGRSPNGRSRKHLCWKLQSFTHCTINKVAVSHLMLSSIQLFRQFGMKFGIRVQRPKALFNSDGCW